MHFYGLQVLNLHHLPPSSFGLPVPPRFSKTAAGPSRRLRVQVFDSATAPVTVRRAVLRIN